MSTATQPVHVLIKPIGARCNLRCDYRFYLDKKSLFPESTTTPPRMTDEMLETTIQRVIEARSPGQREIEFAWQGGEPTLLGRRFFQRAVELQHRYAPQGLRITNAFQTNGVLIDDDFARFFREHRFLVGISIDGPEHLHDRFRRDASGRGSFAAVSSAIEKLQRHGVEYNLLTVVNCDNADHPEEVYTFLKGMGSPFLQFIPLVEPAPTHGASTRSVTATQWGAFLMRVFHLWRKQDIGSQFVQLFDMMLGVTLGHPASLCVHAKTCGRALALEHNGDLFSCDHFVTPNHRLGNISGHSLQSLASSDFQKRFGSDKSASLPETCRSCPELRFCHGGCPKDRVTLTNDGMLNWLCKGYSRFYRESAPYFTAMANALRSGFPASAYGSFMLRNNIGTDGYKLSQRSGT